MGATVLLIDVVLLPRVGIVGAAFSQLISSVAGASLVVGLNWNSSAAPSDWCGSPRRERLSSECRFWPISGRNRALFGGSIAGAARFGRHNIVFGLIVTRYLHVSELVALQKAFSGKSSLRRAVPLEANSA